MLQKKFIRLNTNDNYLSFGNVFRIIIEEANSNNMFFKAELQTSLESLYKQDSNIINFVIGSFYNYKATKEIIENIKAIN